VKGKAMLLKSMLIAFGALALSVPAFARTPECTDLDKAHWTPPQTIQQRLVSEGQKIIDFKVVNTCYRARLEDKRGQQIDAFYHPIGGYPVHRHIM
jgi:hypothetical protein